MTNENATGLKTAASTDGESTTNSVADGSKHSLAKTSPRGTAETQAGGCAGLDARLVVSYGAFRDNVSREVA